MKNSKNNIKKVHEDGIFSDILKHADHFLFYNDYMSGDIKYCTEKNLKDVVIGPSYYKDIKSENREFNYYISFIYACFKQDPNVFYYLLIPLHKKFSIYSKPDIMKVYYTRINNGEVYDYSFIHNGKVTYCYTDDRFVLADEIKVIKNKHLVKFIVDNLDIITSRD